MTALAVGIAGPLDAAAALEGGAALLCLADFAGPLPAPPPPGRLAAVRTVLAGRARLAVVASLAGAADREGADILVLPADADGDLAAFAAGRRLAALCPADEGLDTGLPARLAAKGFTAAATAMHGRAGLLSRVSPGEAGAFLDACRAAGLACGFGGRLEAPDVPRLAGLSPDAFAVRGAVAAGDGDGSVVPERVAALRAQLAAERAAGDVADGRTRGGDTDRVFVRDFTLNLEIGAYGFERGRRQAVRFSVEADVRRPRRPADTIAAVYSYDRITDAVRGLVARGHTDLVETLAEELAATLLADARLAAVTVRVEKLELGPAAVGIEIRRTR